MLPPPLPACLREGKRFLFHHRVAALGCNFCCMQTSSPFSFLVLPADNIHKSFFFCTVRACDTLGFFLYLLGPFRIEVSVAGIKALFFVLVFQGHSSRALARSRLALVLLLLLPGGWIPLVLLLLLFGSQNRLTRWNVLQLNCGR